MFSYQTPDTNPSLPDYIPTFERWKKRYTTPQKQEGHYAVLLPVQQGTITPDTVEKLAVFAAGFGNDVIRFTTRQHIQLRNIPEAYLPDVWLLFRELGFETELPRLCNDVISCTGADTCRLGTCSSQGAAKAIRNRLIESGLSLDEIEAIRINLSGCINSCAQQVWSHIGFSGRVARGDRAYPAYTVYAQTGGEKALGKTIGVISAKDLPDFCIWLFETYLSKKERYPAFRSYIAQEGSTDIEALIREFSPIPTFEEDKNYYFDWGATELFGTKRKNN
ncbi:MAG: hypothetical protein LUG96_09955 [Tannerellaceae bacterium]|nr:hypothetical protein [Tannerellaceae bacterium]